MLMTERTDVMHSYASLCIVILLILLILFHTEYKHFQTHSTTIHHLLLSSHRKPTKQAKKNGQPHQPRPTARTILRYRQLRKLST